jgi:hypothetical protein
MKALRTMVLAFMVAGVSLTATQAFAQQEVDPDHYDQPVATKPAAKPTTQKAATHHHPQGKANLASKHSKQRHSHVNG